MSSGRRHAVCDAGHKSHAIDSGLPQGARHSTPTGELEYANGGDEHGILRPAGDQPARAADWTTPSG
jgi:hypothetical protein